MILGLGKTPPLVLVYHCVADVARAHDPLGLVVPPKRFRAHVESLRARGYEFVTVTDFAARLSASGPPNGVCALTFDDGTDDELVAILGELGVPGTLFVCLGLLGEPYPWLRPQSGIRFMSEATLRDVSALPFIEIGSHTNTHADLGDASEEEAFRELSSSRNALESLGIHVSSFAYPFFQYSAACPAAAERAGYVCAATGGGRGGWLPFELQREQVARRDGRLSFALKSHGAGPVVHRTGLGRLALPVRRVAGRLRAKAE